MDDIVNLLVTGGGPGGYAAALHAAHLERDEAAHVAAGLPSHVAKRRRPARS